MRARRIVLPSHEMVRSRWIPVHCPSSRGPTNAHGLAVDEIKHHVQIRRVVFESLPLVVDDGIGPQFARKFHVVRRSRRQTSAKSNGAGATKGATDVTSAKTRGPIFAFANWMAKWPTPPDPRWINTDSPSLSGGHAGISPARPSGRHEERRRMNMVESRGLRCEGVLVDNGLLAWPPPWMSTRPKTLVAALEPRPWGAAFLDDSRGPARPCKAADRFSPPDTSSSGP